MTEPGKKIQNWVLFGAFRVQNGPKMDTAIKLERETYKFADFLHEGKGTLVEKTGVSPYSVQNQNWGFQMRDFLCTLPACTDFWKSCIVLQGEGAILPP